MAENTAGKRRYYSNDGGITELDLIRIRKEGNVAEEHLKNLHPYFERIKQSIHIKWEESSPSDSETQKILRYQLDSINALQRLLTLDVTRGKQAAKKLEDTKHGK